MTSFKQFEANRRNALKSTGPTSTEGKQRSRCNAVRHGLTAETVIGALEDIEDYQAFEAAITADYDPCTAVERELVLRLASLLWRIRRATAIETDLLRIQSEIWRDCRNTSEGSNECGPQSGNAHRAPNAETNPSLRGVLANGSADAHLNHISDIQPAEP